MNHLIDTIKVNPIESRTFFRALEKKQSAKTQAKILFLVAWLALFGIICGFGAVYGF